MKQALLYQQYGILNEAELEALARETAFSVEELRVLQAEFLDKSSGIGGAARCPNASTAAKNFHTQNSSPQCATITSASGGMNFLFRRRRRSSAASLSAAQMAALGNARDLTPGRFLDAFGMTDALAFSFAERWALLFWRFRVEGSNAMIGFKEFVKVFSVWTRGSLEDRLILLFRLYDVNNRGYLTVDDILSFKMSLFSYYLARGSYDWSSEEFKSSVLLNSLPEKTLTRVAERVLKREAEQAIELHHTAADGRKLLWYDEFKHWIMSQGGVLEIICKSHEDEPAEDRLPQQAASNG